MAVTAPMAPLTLAKGTRRMLARGVQLQFLTLERRPCGRSRIAAADEVVDEIEVVMPVDPRFGITAPTFVARLGFILHPAHGAVGCDQVGSLLEGCNPHRKQAVEIDAPERVVGTDRGLLLQDDGTLIEAVGGPKYAKSGTRIAADDGPVDGTGAPVTGQQRGVELNHAAVRNIDEILRYELKHVGHDAELGVEVAQGLARLVALQRAKLINRDAPLFRRQAQRIGGCAGLLLGGTEHAGHGIASIHECVEHCLTEVPLSYNGNSHHEISLVAPHP